MIIFIRSWIIEDSHWFKENDLGTPVGDVDLTGPHAQQAQDVESMLVWFNVGREFQRYVIKS